MKPLHPLDSVTIHPRCHKTALWWLGTFYRDPRLLRVTLDAMPRRRVVVSMLSLYVHAQPWLWIIIAIIKIFVSIFLLSLGEPITSKWYTSGYMYLVFVDGPAHGFFLCLLFGLAAGLLAGLFGGLVKALVYGLAYGSLSGIVFGGALGQETGLAFMFIYVMLSGMLLGPVIGLPRGIEGLPARGLIGSSILSLLFGLVITLGMIPTTWHMIGPEGWLKVGLAIGLAGAIASFIGITRLYYLPFHLFFIIPTPRYDWYDKHPVAWDKRCGVAFPKLYRLLVSYAEHEPHPGFKEIKRLIDEYPSQKHQAQKAQELLATKE